MRAISILRHKIASVIIRYFMIEFHDSVGRLLVVMSMRVRHAGKLAYVFADGKKVAEFKTVGEAARHARTLAQGRYIEEWGPTPNAEGD